MFNRKNNINQIENTNSKNKLKTFSEYVLSCRHIVAEKNHCISAIHPLLNIFSRHVELPKIS